MTVTLPDDLREVLERGAKADGSPSVEEYLRRLAERDQAGDDPLEGLAEADADRARARLVALIREGLDSGPAEPVGPDFWDSLRRHASEGGQ